VVGQQTLTLPVLVRFQPSQPTKTPLLETKEAFLNDVCPVGQMMCASHMMLPSAMMCPAGREGQTSHHCDRREQHRFGAKRRNIISRLRRRHHSKEAKKRIKHATIKAHPFELC
jgi:hypothetical protein